MSKKIYQYTLTGRYITSHKSMTKAAKTLGVDESTIRKAVKDKRRAVGFYWKDHKDKISEYEISKPKLKRNYNPEVGYLKGQNVIESKNGNVLIIGDTHFPFDQDGYLEHCKAVYKQFNCKTVVHIGDVIDNHAMSFHDTDPDGFGGGRELELAKTKLKDWYESFPNVFVCLGNHDNLSYRKAFRAGMPQGWIKEHSEVLESPPGWRFAERWVIDDVIYEHGIGSSGDMGATNRAKEARQSVVIGHSHSFAGVRYLASRKDIIFGMNVGCGIDEDAYAFVYAKYQPKRPTVACGVVLNYGSQAMVSTMDKY